MSLLFLAVAAVWVWQLYDYRNYARAERDADDRYGEGILAAAEGAMNQQCMLSPTDTDLLQQILEDVRERVGATRIGLYQLDGRPFVVTDTPVDGEDPSRVECREREYRFPEHPSFCAQWIQSGCCVECGYPGMKLQVRLEYPSRWLERRLERGRTRAVSIGGALTLAFLSCFLLYAGHLRATDLSTRLLASAERVRSLEYLRRLAAGLAHEAKNPLGSVRGFAELLHRGDLPPGEVRDAAARVVGESDRLASRLDEFLLLSRPAPLEKRPFDLKALLDELAALIRFEISPKSATIEVSGSEGSIEGDREQVRRLFMNLLVNAADVIPTGGRIEVTLEWQRSGARVVVEDDGPGVPTEIREDLFEPYVTARPGGTGLGLTIAGRIASEHGWTIRYEPAKTRGTRMIVEIADGA